MDFEKSVVITLTGKFGAGKDTVANLLKEEFIMQESNVFVLAYADYLKTLCTRNFAYQNKKEQRFVLQNFGDFVRLNDPNFFVSTVWHAIDTLSNNIDVFIITDCRYENEMKPSPWRLSYPIINVYVDRKVENSADRKHVSEEMANNPDAYLFDYKIDNNGTIENTRKQVKELIDKIVDIYKVQLMQQRGLEDDALEMVEKIKAEMEHETTVPKSKKL